jgi:hypothetical protein
MNAFYYTLIYFSLLPLIPRMLMAIQTIQTLGVHLRDPETYLGLKSFLSRVLLVIKEIQNNYCVSGNSIEDVYLFNQRKAAYSFFLVFESSYFRKFGKHISKIINFFNERTGNPLSIFTCQIFKDSIELLVCPLRLEYF